MHHATFPAQSSLCPQLPKYQLHEKCALPLCHISCGEPDTQGDGRGEGGLYMSDALNLVQNVMQFS